MKKLAFLSLPSSFFANQLPTAQRDILKNSSAPELDEEVLFDVFKRSETDKFEQIKGLVKINYDQITVENLYTTDIRFSRVKTTVSALSDIFNANQNSLIIE